MLYVDTPATGFKCQLTVDGQPYVWEFGGVGVEKPATFDADFPNAISVGSLP